ncbi:cyclin-dependent kinase 4-like [Belonocnema kinseyi]|uniref:cyclin-dependent kinase 4-like n=1 Tax=Belonocnema kinseyi TaxID=2817044 RepID=UPI00143DBF7E|nr:cyclin-dependent kinase 4-like [Belonocnema kinseyi]XP_033219950.1 cyclin-dependent kinase 4-like [Belonocnema kinseyi]XP_033219951.1 cyclin-dependent kinase 4-like [Belonocnema kinseyi]XP_033219953.1 cyclin-dependent kinase 4-like [Belonocnema kinseyi]XP_033219954.1 cyclin-dependent kinase 4-like [Belonocnema kinseyi]XP_033219955.1 cyclin-dependent kinase 4-like [Belonocnema kinseyi]XP_033219956.1 cyclin-dependent kinase 4-like [Belonocnema kinseyi]
MAARSRRSDSEPHADLSSSTPRKRSKKSEEYEFLKEEENTLDKILYTSEKLLTSDESENSSAEGSFALLSSQGTSSLKSDLSKDKGRKETIDKSIGSSPNRRKSLDEGKLSSATRKSVLSDEVRDTEPNIVAGTSKAKQVFLVECRDSDISVSSKSSDMGRPIGEQERLPLTGENALYEDLLLIGNGAYGTVYKGTNITNGNIVALKKVRVPITEDGLPTSTLREIATLKQLERFEHPHIVRLLDVCQGNYLELCSSNQRSSNRGLTLWLVFEHVERDLASYLSSCALTGISSHTVKRMSQEIVKGVDFLHSHRITHRDLKPQNLLVTSEGTIKIADFGLAKTYDFEMRLTSVVVTLWYRAPEVLLGCPYATPVDIWSVGCILAELNRSSPLFPGTSEGDQLDRIFRVIGTPRRHEWPEDVSLSWAAFPQRTATPLRSVIPNLNNHCADLIKSMLSFKPQNRLTAAQSLKHPYFCNES